MVLSMDSGRIARYKKDAKTDMIRQNRSQIRCPCRSCKLNSWMDPDSEQLEEHLPRRGFFEQAPPATGAREDGGRGEDGEVHHDDGYAGGEDHHDDEYAGGEDNPDKEDASGGEDDEAEDGGGGEDANTQTRITSALQDIHVQELLHKETSNAWAAAREKAKLEQMNKDGMTPLFPGCRPQDTRLQVTLDALEMKSNNKWTDVSFNETMEFWHDRLPEGNTLPSSIEEAKKIVYPLDLPHHRYHVCINDCIMYRDEYKDRTTCPKCGHGRYKVGNKKAPRKVVWYFPLTPRLQRYYVDRKEAKLMQWHAEREKPEEDPKKCYILTHPADASQWEALDLAFPKFGGDAR